LAPLFGIGKPQVQISNDKYTIQAGEKLVLSNLGNNPRNANEHEVMESLFETQLVA